MENACIFRCQNTQDSWDGAHISAHDGVAAGVSGRTCSRQPFRSRVSSLLLYKSRAEAYKPDYHATGLALPRQERERETREGRRGRGATQPAEPCPAGLFWTGFFFSDAHLDRLFVAIDDWDLGGLIWLYQLINAIWWTPFTIYNTDSSELPRI